MKSPKTLAGLKNPRTRERLKLRAQKGFCAAAVILFIAPAAALWAEGAAPAAKPAAAPVAGAAVPAGGNPPPAAPVAPSKSAPSSLEGQLQDEVARLQTMELQLKAIESAPLQGAPIQPPKAREEKPAPSPSDVPKEPIKGLEEEFADSLYAIGQYDSARAAYRTLLESKPKADVQAWARFQIANCAKRTGDLPAAAAAYEEVLTTCPTCPWAPDATWWANEIKWRMRWDATAR